MIEQTQGFADASSLTSITSTNVSEELTVNIDVLPYEPQTSPGISLNSFLFGGDQISRFGKELNLFGLLASLAENQLFESELSIEKSLLKAEKAIAKIFEEIDADRDEMSTLNALNELSNCTQAGSDEITDLTQSMDQSNAAIFGEMTGVA